MHMVMHVRLKPPLQRALPQRVVMPVAPRRHGEQALQMLMLQGLMVHACPNQLALRRALVAWVHMLQLLVLQQLLMHECVSQLALWRALVAWMLMTWTVHVHVSAAQVRLW